MERHSANTQEIRVARVVQVTDCHLGPDDDYRLAGVRTLRSFGEVLARVCSDPVPPELVMVSGDIAANGSHDAYARFAGAMAATGLSYAWLPGNHDDFDVMQESLTATPYWPQLDMGQWRLYSLNTAVAGQVGGHLGREELDFLDRSLAREPHNPAALFMHHPPAAIGCDWLDRQRVSDSEALAAVLARHPQVQVIFTGHVHQKVSTDFAGVPLFCTPSTCFQFLANSDNFAIASEPPGFRWIDFYSDGRFETGVVDITDTAEKVDTRVLGY